MSTTKGIAPKKLKKVEEAEALAQREEEPVTDDPVVRNQWETKQTERTNKSVALYTQMCLNGAIGPNDKIEVLVSFLKTVPGEGKEMLIRIRDMIPFCKGKEQDNLVKLLVLICKNPNIDSHERSVTAATLYNHAFLDVCFECFEAIAVDKTVLVKYRIEGARYLFGSGVDENKEVAQECLVEIIGDLGLPSEFRYKIIVGFISRTGFSTYLNSTKIKIPYDEEFVYGLQSCFFYEETNGVRERILSGQHMLDMECVEDSEKIEIADILFAIADNADYDENTRADAADVVLRLGSEEQVVKARELIMKLGYSALGKGDKKNMLDRVKTIYSNSQNIHDDKIAECVAKFIEKIIKENAKALPFEDVHQQCVDLIKARAAQKGSTLDNEKKHRALKALNRVSIDTATFTKYNIGISQVFVHVWMKIGTHKGDVRLMLEDRIIEELVEMGETCSSGHAGRFVNVLAAVDVELRISYESQITANLAGRINARVKLITDADLRASIAMGMLEDADEEDIAAFKSFLSTTLPELKIELYKEFVGEKYISAAEFDKFYLAAEKQWLEFGQQK